MKTLRAAMSLLHIQIFFFLLELVASNENVYVEIGLLVHSFPTIIRSLLYSHLLTLLARYITQIKSTLNFYYCLSLLEENTAMYGWYPFSCSKLF